MATAGSVAHLLAAGALLVTGCGGPTTDSALKGTEAAVRSALTRLMAGDNAGDLDAVMDVYADDVVLLPPGGEPIVGKEAVRAHYSRLFEQVTMSVGMEPDETRVSGDWAFQRGVTIGRVAPKRGGPAQELHDNYLLVLHRDGQGSWRVARLIWNAGGPVPDSAGSRD